MRWPCWLGHDWGKWEEHKIEHYYRDGEHNDLGNIETRQKRICKKCGEMQDRFVSRV
jgi:hypothetical protein